MNEDEIISCKEATRLISVSSERKLTLKERLELKIHLSVCSLCVNFSKQIKYLSQFSSLYLQAIVKNISHPSVSLSSQAKKQIKSFLTKNKS